MEYFGLYFSNSWNKSKGPLVKTSNKVFLNMTFKNKHNKNSIFNQTFIEDKELE